LRFKCNFTFWSFVMKTSPTRVSPVHLLKPLGMLLALGAGHQSATAQASDPNPYYVGVSQVFTRDSNVARAPSGGSSTSDTVSSTGLNAGLNQPFGRQRLRVDANVSSNNYASNSNLNNTGYGLNAAVDWSTIERLSGTLRYSNNQGLANYVSPLTPLLNNRNVQKTEEFAASALLGGVTVLSFTADLSHRALSNSAAAYKAQEYSQNAGSLGVRYRFSGALDAGAALRMTRGSYPNYPALGGATQSDDVNRRDIDLTSNWTPTGLTTVNGRVSLSRQTHSVAASRDFSGATGALTVQHKPAGRLSYTASLTRDTGTENSFFTTVTQNGSTVSLANDSSQISTQFTLAANYDLTAKIQANASVKVLSLQVGTSGLGSGGTDTINGFGLGLTYNPLRNLVIGASLGTERRTTSSALSSDYRTNTVSVSAKYSLQ
jgi:hypothetical protein